MKGWHLVVDIALCHDCNNCFLADKDEFTGNDFMPWSVAQPAHGHHWMHLRRKERGQHPLVQAVYLPTPCMHCDEAPCLTPDGAVYKRPDGLVIIDPVKARGRRDILTSCPYSVIYWNEERQVPQKCTGCAHLLDDGWTQTRCTQVCPTGALTFACAEEHEFQQRVRRDGLRPWRDELGTRPRVYYRNLQRWERSFVGCTVVLGDTDDCGGGARLTVLRDGDVVGAAVADFFGEAVVDGLDPGGDYTLRVAAEGYEDAELTVRVVESVNAGIVTLRPVDTTSGGIHD